jgi:hypothetical protein
MHRFFAFGCSFTVSHDRLTWADIIGREFDFYENWAKAGAGNQYIFNQLVECNTRRKFTLDDTVIIMWTSITREDRYVKNQGGWFGKGSVYNFNNTDAYSEEWIKKFACERGYLIRDLATITAARDLLQYWGVKYKFLAMMPLANPSELTEHKSVIDDNQDVIDLYKHTLSEIKPSVFEVIFNSKNWNKKHSKFGAYVHDGIRDPHPDPYEALEYVQKVLPEISLSQRTIDWVNDFKLGDPTPKFLLKRL